MNRKRIRTLFHNGLLAGSSVLVALLFLECGTRLIIHPTDMAVYSPDPVVGYRLEGLQRGRHITIEIDGGFDVNKSGYNNSHEYTRERVPGRFRIALLGDSYVEAIHVRPGERLFDLLEKDLNDLGMDTEIYTFAASGYGTGQQLLILENEVLAYRPDLVVVLFVNNDLRDTACALGGGGPKPCFYLDEETGLNERPFEQHRPNRLGRLLMRSALFRYLFLQRGILDRLRRLASPTTIDLRDGFYLEKPGPEWITAWEVVGECLQEMARLSREAGAEFLVVNRPPLQLVEQGNQPDAPDGIDYRQPIERLSELAEAGGYRFHDLTPDFQRATAAGRGPFHFQGDSHWNAAGHRVAAEALFEMLREALQRVAARKTGAPARGLESVRAAPQQSGPGV